jgi:hypothetical protein
VTPTELPYVDEHSVAITAAPEAAWAALIRTIRGSFSGPVAGSVARLLDCDPRAASDWSRPAPGCSLPGFEATTVEPPSLIRLSGRHRFSEYALTFRIDEVNGGCRCRAETHARFPGLRGRLYRTTVIGSRGHRFAVLTMLGNIKRLAEQEAS